MLSRPSVRVALAAGTAATAAAGLWLALGRPTLWGRFRRRSAPTVKAQKSQKQGGKPQQEQQSQPKQQHVRDKGRARLEWWQQLNEVKPALTLPAAPVQEQGDASLEPPAYRAVANMVDERLNKGRDYLSRDSDYGEAPAHAGVKAKVNAAILRTVLETFGESLPQLLAADPRNVILLLETPLYGTLTSLASAIPILRCCQQVVIPQADLRHYFEMIRGDQFYVGVRAQRLDHWLCANATKGLKCLVSFLDYECRLAGARSARLCPAADVMRYFRFGFPADQTASVLAITVGLEEPASTPEEVDAFIRWEARLNGYEAELKETWKYRMVSLLYVVRRLPALTATS